MLTAQIGQGFAFVPPSFGQKSCDKQKLSILPRNQIPDNEFVVASGYFKSGRLIHSGEWLSNKIMKATFNKKRVTWENAPVRSFIIWCNTIRVRKKPT